MVEAVEALSYAVMHDPKLAMEIARLEGIAEHHRAEYERLKRIRFRRPAAMEHLKRAKDFERQAELLIDRMVKSIGLF